MTASALNTDIICIRCHIAFATELTPPSHLQGIAKRPSSTGQVLLAYLG